MSRNGKIEILRFIFCMFVFLYHIGNDLAVRASSLPEGITFFGHGRSGVEFFLLLSGFFCAASVYRTKNAVESIGASAYSFIKKKILKLFPVHIICCLLTIVLMFVYKAEDFSARETLRDILPSLFFMQRTGVGGRDLISVEWYICSMLLALAVIYPMLKKNFDLTACLIAPVLSSLTIGYLLKTYNSMPKTNLFEKYTYVCNIRAFAVVLLGVFCFAVSLKIRDLHKSVFTKIILLVVENACWLWALYFIISDYKGIYEGHFIYITALAITLCMSRDFKTKLYQNKIAMCLGRISLPIYLCQNIIRTIVKYEFFGCRLRYVFAFSVVFVILLGVLIELILSLFKVFKSKCKINKEIVLDKA